MELTEDVLRNFGMGRVFKVVVNGSLSTVMLHLHAFPKLFRTHRTTKAASILLTFTVLKTCWSQLEKMTPYACTTRSQALR